MQRKQRKQGPSRSQRVRCSSLAALLLAMAMSTLLALSSCGEDQGLHLDFTGSDHVSKSDLKVAARRELQEFKQHPSEAALADAGYAMEQALAQQGFAHGQVNFQLLSPTGGVPHARFTITEGPRAYLRELHFPGATHFSEAKLRGALQGEGIGWFDLDKAPFRYQDLDRAGESIESLYLIDGYYRVVIGKPVVTFSADHHWASARIPIKEGLHYTISAIAYDFDLSGSGMARRDFRAVLAQTDLVGKPYYARLPSFTQSRIRSWLADRGHLDANVTSSVSVDDARTRAGDLHHRCRTGLYPQAAADHRQPAHPARLHPQEHQRDHGGADLARCAG
jgi:outer membrane protein assembly factor BamA